MNIEPSNANGRQVVASVAFLAAAGGTPVVCWFVIPHTPWWGWAASTAVVSFSVLLVGGGLLARILKRPDSEPGDRQ